MKRLLTFFVMLTAVAALSLAQQKVPVFIYAGQSNADGREYTTNLPDYMLDNGSLPSSPYTHLKWASICGNPSKSTFDTRTFQGTKGERYAFCDVTNYWIDQAISSDFYAIKCAYGGTAIAPGVTADKLPIWYADAEWMTTHNAYKGDDITQTEYANNNSLTKNLTEGVASLIDGTLATIDGGYDVKAIMWHQGESDRNASGQYYTNFKTMIAYMRQAIYAKTGDEADLSLPFIFGTVCRRSSQYSAGVEQAQIQVAAEDENVYLIDMKNATLLSDNLHFDKQATEYLGKKMYNQLVELGLVPGGTAVDVEEFPVKTSVMDNVEVPTPDNRSWDFTSFSQQTKDALAADAALTSGSKWNTGSGWGYRRSNGIFEEQLTANSVVISETEGLYFSGAQGNRVTLNTSNGYLGFVDSSPTVFIPKLTAGQLIYVTLRGNKESVKLKAGQDMDEYIELVGENEVGTSDATVCYRVRYNVTLPTHIGLQTSGPAFIKKIWIKTPETVNILIGADQKETFSCDHPLDFSPFTDLFKAYVVTGYDDANGVVECEQVLQVPANTGVLLMGEESTVNAPIIEGAAPAAPVINLLTAVVGEGTAPAGSFVLTTSGGATQFTKVTADTNLNNQAYLASLGENTAYGFRILEPRNEHIYNIVGGNILTKGTVLTFGSKKHHTVIDGSISKDVYIPENADGLENRFAFDNGGKWCTDNNNGTLGYTYKNNPLYASVLSLNKSDCIKIEVNSQTSITVLNNILFGVEAGSTLNSGASYVIASDTDKAVNLDFKIDGSSNRFGITKITVWSNTKTGIEESTINITVSDIGYATFCSDQALDFTESGITAYYATADGDNVNFNNEIANPAAETGLLLKAEPGTYAVAIVNEGTDVSDTNLLNPCLEEKTVGETTGCEYGKVFILSVHEGQKGFYKSNNGSVLQAGKSYLYLENPSEAHLINGFSFDGELTGIAEVADDNKIDGNTTIYNMSGQRLSVPVKGLNIINGKKIFIK